MIKRHAVQVLLQSGLSHRQVARQTGISKRTVTRIAQEAEVDSLDDERAARTRLIGRPSSAEPFRLQVQALLDEEPHLPTVEILHRVRGLGYTAGKSALYDLVRAIRGAAPPPVMVRFEGTAGEFAQFDFGQVKVRDRDGRTAVVHFACYRLKYSRWVHVELVPNEQVEALSRALLRSFELSGGVPLAVVFDNPKTVVIHPKQTPIVWNRTVAQLSLDYGFAIELCTPRRANQKGAVENLVGWVKGSFFKVRRFQDPEDLVQQLAEWLAHANEERPSRATGEPLALRLAEEQTRLRPLKIPAAEYGLHFESLVGPTGIVTHRGIRYAMPAESIGIPATLRVYPDRVRITAGRHDVTHPRFPARGVSYPSEIKADHLARVSGERGRLYFKRERIMDLGAAAVHFVTEIVRRRPRTWKGDIEALFELLQSHREEAFLAALQAAELRGLFGAEYVRAFAEGEVA